MSGFCPDKQITSKIYQKIDNLIITQLLIRYQQSHVMYKKFHPTAQMLSCSNIVILVIAHESVIGVLAPISEVIRRPKPFCQMFDTKKLHFNKNPGWSRLIKSRCACVRMTQKLQSINMGRFQPRGEKSSKNITANVNEIKN